MSTEKIKIDDENADGKAASAELYFVLSSKTSGEAFDLVKTVEDLNGAESWRLLTARFDPKTIGKPVLLARRCVNPPKVNQAKDLPGAIDRWEDDVRRIQNVYKEPLGEGLKRAILVEMLPSTLIEGVMARLKQDDTYDSVKDMVLDYVSTRVDSGGPQSMDCSNFNNYDDTSTPDEPSWMELNWVNKGEAKGKSKGKGFQEQCHNCGECGHRAAECPAKGGAGRVVTPHTELRIAPKAKGKARTTRA